MRHYAAIISLRYRFHADFAFAAYAAATPLLAVLSLLMLRHYERRLILRL